MAQPTTALQQVPLPSSLSSSPYTHSLDVILPPSSHTGLGLDDNLLSRELTQSVAVGQGNKTEIDHGGQKFTLLTRSHTQANTVSSLPTQSALTSAMGSRLDDSVVSRISSIQPAGLHQTAAFVQDGGDGGQQLLVKGRARGYLPSDDYYDTEDPSVNLHEFIINSLQAQKNRIVLLKLEEEFLKYVTDSKRTEPFKLPSWDSYHRMLAHRVAAYFGLDHNVDPHDKTRVVVCKGLNTRIPVHRFMEYIPAEEAETAEPKLILKRMRGNSGSDKFDSGALSGCVSEVKTFEEREEEYEKARARIFAAAAAAGSSQLPTLSSQPTDVQGIPFDLISSSPLVRSLPPPMHHRRTASDTAFINKLFAPKELKQGPSSSGNSPSNTPAFFSSSISPPLSSTQGSSSISQLSKSVPDSNLSQHTRQQQKRVGRPHPPAFMPLYTGFSLQPNPSTATAATAAIPVLYHPQTAMVDPSWYYNPMVLYPMSPGTAGGYSYSTQYSPVVQSPVVHPYSMTTPGLMGQLSGGELRHRMQVGGVSSQETVTSPTHPGGMVVRPIPQPAVTSNMHKPDEYGGQTTPLWSPGAPTGLPFSTGMTNTQLMGGGHCQPMYPGVHNFATATQQLAEQMEKNLTLSGANGGMVFPGGGQVMSGMFPPVGEGLTNPSDKSRASPIGQKQQLALMMQNLPGAAHKNNGVTAASMYGYPSMDPALMSPTQLGPTHQFIPSHMMGQLSMGLGPEGGGHPHLPYPSSLPLHVTEPMSSPHPPTPTMGHIPPVGHQQPTAQNMFSPPSSAMTHSPIQILGHTLSTSIFSPPPSAGPPHGLFITQPSATGKGGIAPGSPAHAPVGSGGTRLRRYDSPKQGRADLALTQQHSQSPGLMGALAVAGNSRGLPGVEVSSGLVQQQSYGNTAIIASAVSDVPSFSQTQQLPPRLAQRSASSNRYQNQRHPSNRPPPTKAVTEHNSVYSHGSMLAGGGLLMGQQQPQQGQQQIQNKREPLLPTPSEMIKLDTGITAGVPVNVMEVVNPPPEDSSECQQLMQRLKDCEALEFKRGWMSRGTEVMVAVFDSPDTALKALKQCVLPAPAKLSIPLPNHAKHILQLL